MPHRLRESVAAQARFRCEYCRAPEALFNSPFEVEHIEPLARGGTDDAPNLALACRACNGSKYVATTAVDPTGLHEVRLFHPRVDTWSEHFTLDARTAEIVGQTAIGRATVERLQMNGPRAIRARRLWARLFAFPDDPPDVQG
jgi:hypothetical protein